MNAAEFIIKNNIDLHNCHFIFADGAGNAIIQGSTFWLYVAADGHTERVYT